VTDLLALLGVGFFLGMRHATDPDHVMAVTAIVAREGSARAAVAVGAFWGLGHTLTVLVVGSAIVFFGLVVPPRLGLSMEMSAAAMLIVLGAVNVRSALGHIEQQGNLASDGHGHAHAHAHAHVPASPGRALGRFARPLAVGVVHGLAGSAAVALLVLAAVHSVKSALVYLAVFGVGTMFGMLLLTAVMARPLAKTATWSAAGRLSLVRITGFASLALGLFLVYRIGVVDGLFTHAATWRPQ
jgi:high-affinity nickel permease